VLCASLVLLLIQLANSLPVDHCLLVAESTCRPHCIHLVFFAALAVLAHSAAVSTTVNRESRPVVVSVTKGTAPYTLTGTNPACIFAQIADHAVFRVASRLCRLCASASSDNTGLLPDANIAIALAVNGTTGLGTTLLQTQARIDEMCGCSVCRSLDGGGAANLSFAVRRADADHSRRSRS
jgi:hypothetical protein